jgi:DNA-directed RNA polymerase specialized sigma24 family protein
MLVPSESTSIRGLLAGDELAFNAVWNQHYRRLRELVACKLTKMPPLAGKESDIAVQTMHLFLVGAAAGQFADLTDQTAIWRLLRTIARRKISDELKYARADKRGGSGIPGGLTGAAPNYVRHITDAVEQLPDLRTRTADDRVDLEDLLEHMLAILPDDTARSIILMRLQGLASAEIAAKTDLSTRSVQRRLKEICRWWTSEFLG